MRLILSTIVGLATSTQPGQTMPGEVGVEPLGAPVIEWEDVEAGEPSIMKSRCNSASFSGLSATMLLAWVQSSGP